MERRGARTDLRNNSSGDIKKGRTRDFAAESVHLSGGHAEKGLKVLKAIRAQKLQEGDRNQRVEEILQTLKKKGIEAAFVEAREEGWIKPPKPATKERSAKTTPDSQSSPDCSTSKSADPRAREVCR